MAPEQLEEFGVAISQQFAGRLEDARQELIEAMKLVGRSDYRDLHVEAGELVNRLDGLRLKLVERGGIDHG